jgi:trans-aconitate methyltransferase
MMKFTGERVVPWAKGMQEHPYILEHHVARYNATFGGIAGKHVVDLGCGTGYGSFLMSWLAEGVIGLDCDKETITFAARHFGRIGLEFWWWDIERQTIPPADVYVAFEVLEHLKDPQALLGQLSGPLVWSLPVDSPSEFHRHVFTLEEAEEFVPGSRIFYQLKTGLIMPRELTDWKPKYVVGIRP